MCGTPLFRGAVCGATCSPWGGGVLGHEVVRSWPWPSPSRAGLPLCHPENSSAPLPHCGVRPSDSLGVYVPPASFLGVETSSVAFFLSLSLCFVCLFVHLFCRQTSELISVTRQAEQGRSRCLLEVTKNASFQARTHSLSLDPFCSP